MASRNFREIPTPSSLLSAYASMSTSIMLFRTMFNQLFPTELRRYIVAAVRYYWKPKSSKLTLVIEEKDDMTSNHMFVAAEAFLCSRINPNSERLRVTKSVKENHINIKFAESEEIVDSFDGISVTWRYVRKQPKHRISDGDGDDVDYGGGTTSSGACFYPEIRRYFKLEFDKMHKDVIINSYLPWIIKRSEDLQNEKKVVKLYTLQNGSSALGGYMQSVNLDHPSTESNTM